MARGRSSRPHPSHARTALADAIRAAYPQGVEAVISVVDAAVTALATEMGVLRQEVTELRRRIDSDSRTSSKPPSTDVSRALRPVSSLREKSGRRPGGQPGHRGRTLAWRASPDIVASHLPHACEHCGQLLAAGIEGAVEGVVIERAQVVDLPLVRLRTTEHQRVALTCARCGHASTGAFPGGIEVGVQYGPELKALAVALHSQHFLPYGRTAEMLAALLGEGPSVGTLVRWTREAAEALRPVVVQAAEAIISSPSAHGDETGIHVEGETWWLHVASTATHTHYHIHPRRGRAAMDTGGVWEGFGGTMVHDALASYFQYKGATHQLCLAHLQREARGLVELTRSQSPRRRPEGWLEDIGLLLGRLHRLVTRAARAGRRALDPRTIRRLGADYDAVLKRARRLHPPVPVGRRGVGSGRVWRGPVAAFADRLLAHRADVLRCAGDTRIAPDNNQAERDLRMAKLADKTSGGFRTSDAAHDFATLRSALSTARKHGHTAIACLRDAFTPSPAPALSG